MEPFTDNNFSLNIYRFDDQLIDLKTFEKFVCDSVSKLGEDRDFNIVFVSKTVDFHTFSC